MLAVLWFNWCRAGTGGRRSWPGGPAGLRHSRDMAAVSREPPPAGLPLAGPPG